MGIYSRDVVAESVPAGEPFCIVLPAPMRGALDRLIVKQTTGDDDGYSFNLYDRKGACVGASDLHTTNGEVTAITEGGGTKALIEAEAHELTLGATIEVKGSDVTSYNTTHTVIEIVSEDTVLTDIDYTADGSGGRWQTTPEVYATRNPVIHVLLGPISVAGGGSGLYQNFNVGQSYENRDNQNLTARRRASALYLEITTVDVGDKNFEIAYTVDPNIVD